jgi:hypothetical protein
MVTLARWLQSGRIHRVRAESKGRRRRGGQEECRRSRGRR